MKVSRPDQSYEPAALCLRVRLITILCLVLTVGAGIVISILQLREHSLPEHIRYVVFPLCWVLGPSIVGGVWFGARLKGYLISDGALLVKRTFYTPRFDLAGLSSVEITREPMKWALKVYGNDGLGAIAGTFRSKQWGKFKAYLTDNKCAVVLRWTDGRCVIVSPKQTDYFIQELKKHMG
jgi:Bacterial PH domain